MSTAWGGSPWGGAAWGGAAPPSGPNNYTITFTAGLSFTGSATKATTKGPFTAGLSFTGSIAKATVKIPFKAALSFAGTLSRLLTPAQPPFIQYPTHTTLGPPPRTVAFTAVRRTVAITPLNRNAAVASNDRNADITPGQDYSTIAVINE